ncbi:hypothetical protein [Cupriavidus sp. 8B]
MKLTASRANISIIDHHSYICDLLYLEGPILSLFRDAKQNWLYLWCDTDGETSERWLVFSVTRAALIGYFEKREALIDVLRCSSNILILDKTAKENFDENGDSQGFSVYRTLKTVDDLHPLTAYLPEPDSFFDESLAPDISLARELNPTPFDVPIDGRWFVSDLDKFSKVYSQLYAFFYCTKPRFVTNIGERIKRYLSAPWRGGYSRVNLFEALQGSVPSLHDLEIKHIKYASPGEIRIEALRSVGDSIAGVIKNYLSSQATILLAEKKINTLLGSNQLKKSNLSSLPNEKLPLKVEDINFLEEQRRLIAQLLKIEEELDRLSSYSPNIVVSTKVLIALVARVRRASEFEDSGLLDLSRPDRPVANSVPLTH